jgi:3-hydroxybutyryl-CoA dehydrogenase
MYGHPLSYRGLVHEGADSHDLTGAVVGVVGAGTMGAGIAQVALEGGHEVVLYDVDELALERGVDRLRTGLGRRAARLELDAGSIDDWVEGRLANLRTALTLDAVGAVAEVVIEAALEDLDLKRTIFLALDRDLPAEALLATNTSALPVAAIAEATNRPGRVLGLHFFNPAPLMALVEVIRGPQTDEATVDQAVELMKRWGKTPVVSEDAPGFIVNRVNRPFTIEALRMLEAGAAGIADIDEAIRGAGYPMGPFELMDLIGIDVNLAVATAVWEGLGRPDRLRPSPIQQRLVDERRLGRKTGLGFYAYPDRQRGEPADDLLPARARADSIGAADVVSRIEGAIAREAGLALADGVASADAIDAGLRLGAGHPSGPFEAGRVPPGPP